MKFIDMNNDYIYTIADLKNDWNEFKEESPENHADSFKAEFHEILMATINGRNDLKIIGMTPREISNYIMRLRATI